MSYLDDGDDDAALLRAALDSIDAWDVEGGSLLADVSVVSIIASDDGYLDTSGTDASPTGTDSSSDGGASLLAIGMAHAGGVGAGEEGGCRVRSAHTTTRSLKPSTLASTSHKRQNEIVYLKDKIQELQQELVALKANDRRADESGIDREVTLMWQRIADRNKRMRHQAEVEQIRLRRLLEMQLKASQQLIEAFQTVRVIQDEAADQGPKRRKLIHTQIPLSQRERDQLAELEKRYLDIHREFTEPKFNDGTVRFLDIQVVEDGDGSVLVELLDNSPVPFETARVLDALWKDTLRCAEKKWQYLPDSEVEYVHDHDVDIVRFTILGDSNTEGQFTSKRFYGGGNDTPAIISITHGTPIVIGAKGVHFREDVWLRIVPAPAHCSSPKQPSFMRSYPLSLVQSIRRFRVDFKDLVTNEAEDRKLVGFITNMVLDKLKANVESKHEVLETLFTEPRS